MRSVYTVLLIIVLGVSIRVSGQDKKEVLIRDSSNFFPSVGDSSNYKKFYAIEIIRTGKAGYRDYSREGSHIKFSWKRKPVKGKWYFLNYPDTIIVKGIKNRDNIILSVNAIQSVQFKRYSGSTGGQAAVLIGSTLVLGTPALGNLVGPGPNWSFSHLLFKSFISGEITLRRENKYDKKIREKVENELILEKEKEFKKKAKKAKRKRK